MIAYRKLLMAEIRENFVCDISVQVTAYYTHAYITYGFWCDREYALIILSTGQHVSSPASRSEFGVCGQGLKGRLRLPPHLYFVTTSRIKTRYCWYRRYMFDLLMSMAHKQSHVTVVLNKRHYTGDIAVFDMFTVMLPTHSTFFKTTTPLVEATVNKTFWYFFPFGDYCPLQ